MPAAPEPAADPAAALRNHLIWLLDGGHAHADLATLAAAVPPGKRGTVPVGLAHSAYQLVEHLRRCQDDLIAHGRDPDHVSPEFPDGYWPDPEPGPGAWDDALSGIAAGRAALRRLVREGDPLAGLPHAAGGVTLARNVLVVCDHDAYHLGQLAQVAALLT